MCEKRYHIEIEPGCTATFNTPTPSPETIRILKDVIRMAMEKEAPLPTPPPQPNHQEQ